MDRDPVIGPSSPIHEPEPVQPKSDKRGQTQLRGSKRRSPAKSSEEEKKKVRTEKKRPNSNRRVDRYA